MQRFISLFFITLYLAGCASLPVKDGFVFQQVETTTFPLATWENVKNQNEKLRIYIEGDGFAWVNSYRPSYNPTPKSTFLFDLAEQDKNRNVVYIARPCQYVWCDTCNVYYWTMGRFDKKVIQAELETVQYFIKKHNPKTVELVGYSGGATVALLVALNEPKVSKVVTVAGVLNHKQWTSYHQDSPLTGSLNPIDNKDNLKTIKQIHYVGGKDKIVPKILTQQYISDLGNVPNIKYYIIPNATHNKGWDEIWIDLLAMIDKADK